MNARVPRLHLVPLLMGLVPFSLLVARFNFVCDDAFIGFRYARNFAQGLGLRFNAGIQPPVEGYSEFLWTLLMAAVEWLGGDVTLWSRVISIACGAGLLVYVTWFLQRRLCLRPYDAGLAAVFLGTLPPMAVWSTGGMATMPFALAVFAAFERLLGSPAHPRGMQAGLFALLAALLRADGAVWGAAVAGIGAATALTRRDRSLLRASGVAVGLLVAGTAVHIAWRYGYYADFLPNTARAKVALTPWTLRRGWYYVVSFFLTFPSVLFLFIFSPFWASRVKAHILLQAWSMCAVTFLYALVIGGDFMAMGRFLVPSLAFACVLIAVLLRQAARQGLFHRSLAVTITTACILLSVLPAFNIYAVPHSMRQRFPYRGKSSSPRSEYEEWRSMKTRAMIFVVLGRALKAHAAPGASVVSRVVGAVGYYSELFLYDQCGLTWREPALRRVRRWPGQAAGHDRCVRFQFFAKYRPTYLWAALVGPRNVSRKFPRGIPAGYEPRLVWLSGQQGFSPNLVLALVARQGEHQPGVPASPG